MGDHCEAGAAKKASRERALFTHTCLPDCINPAKCANEKTSLSTCASHTHKTTCETVKASTPKGGSEGSVSLLITTQKSSLQLNARRQAHPNNLIQVF